MPDWITRALDAVRAGEPLAMATVVGADGSTPREAGARMLVWPDRFSGTIGGGALERQALDQARRLLGQTGRRHALQDYPLGPLLGQCCGGRVRLLVERLDADSEGWLADVAAACAAGRPFRLQTDLGGDTLTRRITDAQDAGPDTLVETVAPVTDRLAIFGAGHVGQAVARAFAPLPFRLDWLASREDLAPEAGLARASLMAEDDLEAFIEGAPPGGFYVIFTHSHDLDYRLTRAVLRRGDFRYLGLIGSKTKRVRFERRLGAEGIGDDALARLTCPIGLRSIRSKAPAAIAVGLAAELLAMIET